jgi:hypothetical protein
MRRRKKNPPMARNTASSLNFSATYLFARTCEFKPRAQRTKTYIIVDAADEQA